MGFLFGLFRFLTWGNLIVQGFFMMCMLILMINLPVEALSFMMILGFILFHNILCLQLQRVLKAPALPLSKSFPPRMMVVSVITFLISIMILGRLAIPFALIPMSDYIEMVKKTPTYDPSLTEEMLVFLRNFTSFLMFSYAIAIGANCVISSVFLNRWKKTQQTEEEEFMPGEE